MSDPRAGQRKDRTARRISSTGDAGSRFAAPAAPETMAQLDDLLTHVRRCEAIWRFSDRLEKARKTRSTGS
ncbi:MAG: hypothetical protein LBJ87_04045 [bacterium]|jgi:hypothetical protein|nr:hypothetical protein [bacterium]